MNNELMDVTEFARKYGIQLPGWRVVVTRRVWDQWIGTPIGDTDPREVTRLQNVLGYLSAGLKELATPEAGYFPGFGVIGRATNEIHESRKLGLAAFAMIGSGGSPYMLVMTPEEGSEHAAISSEAASIH